MVTVTDYVWFRLMLTYDDGLWRRILILDCDDLTFSIFFKSPDLDSESGSEYRRPLNPDQGTRGVRRILEGGGNNWQLPPPPFPKANTYLYIQPAVLNCLKGVKGTVLISVMEPVQS